MDIAKEVQDLIGKPEGVTLEYKAVLPPSRNIAQLISAFANTEGGYIILGVSEDRKVNGLSEDFHANAISHKAMDLVSPLPTVIYQYVPYKNKSLYAIKVLKSDSPVATEGKIYKRVGVNVELQNATEIQFKSKGYKRIKSINQQLEDYKKNCTFSKAKLIEHYQSILKIIDDLSSILYPNDPNELTNVQEGKILSRILFSSFVDNFEAYLSDLLYEIYLAKPETLKSQEQKVSIEEVLNCSDLHEFVKYWAKQRLLKLQKGSVKGFIKENKQIKNLEIFDKAIQDEVERILQIRHLYSHRNGIVDEKFQQFYREFTLNSEHQLSINESCDKLCYLSEIVDQLDQSAILKYSLAKI